MQHLDEGTVHAWLDGELSEAESAAALQHVTECAQCAELVAEARGLIAGAARVVAALDAGPAGVIPKSPVAAPPRWRRFASNSSRMAMAATILVALGVTLTVRHSRREDMAPRPVVEETPTLPMAPPSPAPAAASSPAPSAPPAAGLKDRASASKQAPTTASKAAVGDAAGFISKPAARSAPTNAAVTGAVADNALADKKKDELRRDRPDVAKTLTEVKPGIAAGAPPVRADSTALRQAMAKVAADSVAATPGAQMVRRLASVEGGTPVREAAAKAQNSRAASFDALNEASMQGCYRLSLDTSMWRGVLPAAFVLAGPPSRVSGAAGGQIAAAQAAPASTNAVQRFSQKPELAGFGVHAIGANGHADSAAIGDWTTTGPTAARVRFVNAGQTGMITVTFSTASPVARVTTGDRTDSLPITRVVCPR